MQAVGGDARATKTIGCRNGQYPHGLCPLSFTTVDYTPQSVKTCATRPGKACNRRPVGLYLSQATLKKTGAAMGQSAVQAWYQALRPRVFTATYAPMGLAGIIAINDGVFDAGIFLLALIGTLLLQSAANLINEYADYRRGADQLKEAGQGMTIKKKILKPASVRNGAVLTTVAGCLNRPLPAGPKWSLALDHRHRRRICRHQLYRRSFPIGISWFGRIRCRNFYGTRHSRRRLLCDVARRRGCAHCRAFSHFPASSLYGCRHPPRQQYSRYGCRPSRQQADTGGHLLGFASPRAEFMFLVVGAYATQLLVIALGIMPVATLLTLITVPEALALDPYFQHQPRGAADAPGARSHCQAARSNWPAHGPGMGFCNDSRHCLKR